ncbi:MAG: class III poly(R)-hydroxyalkanoic acid synthase subunit PhaC [Legionellales bacterium]|nr:class III poly(R)-hydroxyalkanoic acid synthase subunit PhaC [Legionellales bacterium]
MNPFNLILEDIVNEIHEFNIKLAKGYKSLSDLGEIQVGVSEKEAVHQEDNVVLYHFKSRTKNQNPIPLLIVYALVNRPYIVDLHEECSIIQELLDEGVDVYLIDWGYPVGADKYLTLDDYINGYIDRCVDVICEKCNRENINLLGICQGGVFSLCYTALNPKKVKNLITTTTPVDFHTKQDLLSHIVKKIDIDKMVDTLGNIPGEVLNVIFLSLKPYTLMGQKYVSLVKILDDKEKLMNFMRMEKWIFDTPDLVGEAYREFIKQFYQQNRLIKGTVKIGDNIVDLSKIIIPTLNIYARDDHLVPPDASIALESYINSQDYQSLEFPGGHIGIYVSRKVQNIISQNVAVWLENRN